jgi:hypothetical protein
MAGRTDVCRHQSMDEQSSRWDDEQNLFAYAEAAAAGLP